MSNSFIEDLNKLLLEINSTKDRLNYLKPVRPRYDDDNEMCESKEKTVEYDRLTVGHLEGQIDSWQLSLRSLLIDHYGSNSSQYMEFKQTCGNNREYKDAKNDLLTEIKTCQNAIISIIESENKNVISLARFSPQKNWRT